MTIDAGSALLAGLRNRVVTLMGTHDYTLAMPWESLSADYSRVTPVIVLWLGKFQLDMGDPARQDYMDGSYRMRVTIRQRLTNARSAGYPIETYYYVRHVGQYLAARLHREMLAPGYQTTPLDVVEFDVVDEPLQQNLSAMEVTLDLTARVREPAQTDLLTVQEFRRLVESQYIFAEPVTADNQTVTVGLEESPLPVAPALVPISYGPGAFDGDADVQRILNRQ